MLSLSSYLKNPRLIGSALLKNYGAWIPDKAYLKLLYYFEMGKRLDLKSPQTFSEKLQWLKLYNRRPEYTSMVDKYAVKEYVSKLIGEKYVIPTLGVWNRAEEIDWDGLPNQFVLKTTHSGGSTGVVICQDKNNFDRTQAISKLNLSLKSDGYEHWREWPYKNVPRRILAEKYIDSESNTKDLRDYKFFCFNGEPHYCQIISGRDTKMSIDFFDRNWNHQPFHEPINYPFAEIEPKCPENYELMWNLATLLAFDKPFSRIDFYNVNGKVYFGEITFFPTSGMGGFDPQIWDVHFGNMITLPKTD